MIENGRIQEVAMCGCDFTMNLPRLGARTLWKYRHRLQNLNLALPHHIVLAMNLMYYDMMLQKNVTPHLMQHSANLQSIDEDTCKQAYQLTITRVQKNSTMSPLIKSCLWSCTPRARTRVAAAERGSTATSFCARFIIPSKPGVLSSPPASLARELRKALSQARSTNLPSGPASEAYHFACGSAF